VVKVLQAFKKTVWKSTANLLLAGRESIMLMIADSKNKDYDD